MYYKIRFLELQQKCYNECKEYRDVENLKAQKRILELNKAHPIDDEKKSCKVVKKDGTPLNREEKVQNAIFELRNGFSSLQEAKVKKENAKKKYETTQKEINESVTQVPLLSKITAGNPIEAIERPDEYFQLPSYLVPKNKDVLQDKVLRVTAEML